METTFENITQQLIRYKADADQCEKMVLEILGQNPQLLPDPAILCLVLRNTAYFKREAVYELGDFFKLHELHPIHLLLSLEESPDLYFRLYDLYRFQKSPEPSLRIPLILQYQDDPEITAKQIEVFAYDSQCNFTKEIEQAFGHTQYMKDLDQKIKESSGVIPYLIIEQKMATEMPLLISEFTVPFKPENQQKINNQSKFMFAQSIMNLIALELELLQREPLYNSNRLTGRLERISLLADTLKKENYIIPEFIKEGFRKIGDNLQQLEPGIVLYPRRKNEINTAIKFSVIKGPDDIFWEKIKSLSQSEPQKDLNDIISLSRNIEYSDIDDLINNFRSTKNLLSGRVPPFQCTLEMPPEFNLWGEYRLLRFVMEFMQKLELDKVGFVAAADKMEGVHKIHIISQNYLIKENKCYPLGLATVEQRSKEILVQLEQKYDIQQNMLKHIKMYLNKETSNLQQKNATKGKLLSH